MLRVLRFGARLQFKLAADTAAAIAEHGHLLRDIPPARLFDEWLKLFMNGCSAPTFSLLHQFGLITQLMGEDVTDALDIQRGSSLRMLALSNTDQRVADERPVTPAFLLAALYWPATERSARQLSDRGESPIPAMHSAGQQIVAAACQYLAIPKRFSLAMRDIWDLQPRLERMQPKKVKDLIAHRWFRAAFDLRLLREETHDLDNQCSHFWVAAQKQHPELVGSARQRRDDAPRRGPRPRRRPRNA